MAVGTSAPVPPSASVPAPAAVVEASSELVADEADEVLELVEVEDSLSLAALAFFALARVASAFFALACCVFFAAADFEAELFGVTPREDAAEEGPAAMPLGADVEPPPGAAVDPGWSAVEVERGAEVGLGVEAGGLAVVLAVGFGVGFAVGFGAGAATLGGAMLGADPEPRRNPTTVPGAGSWPHAPDEE